METESTPEEVIEAVVDPIDAVSWAKPTGGNSWHIVKSISGDTATVLDGDTYVLPEYRADLGAEKSCELCMRVYMQSKDL